MPLTVPSRTFPRLEDILNDVSTFGESMPTRSRTMVFRLTARDNRIGGGGVNYASTTVTISGDAGPFIVTQPNSSVTWSGNSTQTVSWLVANSTAAPVSCANVEIDLSTDGGNTFPTVLLASTPNDGTERVTIPNTPTGLGRIRVSCVGNIFFDISDANFSINPDDGLPAPTLSSISPTSGPIAGGTVVTLTGTGFVNGATVYFGVAQATSVTFNSATSLTATSPAYSAGTADVTVTNPDFKNAVLSGAFQFFDHSGMLIFRDGFESGDTSLWSRGSRPEGTRGARQAAAATPPSGLPPWVRRRAWKARLPELMSIAAWRIIAGQSEPQPRTIPAITAPTIPALTAALRST